MRIVASTICAALLSGCGITRPYVELGVGLKLDGSIVTEPECDTVILPADYRGGGGHTRAGGVTSCGGRNPTAHFAAGVEFDPRAPIARFVSECGWRHWSHYRDGWPFQSDHTEHRELRWDELVCAKRWGGYR